LVAMLRRRSVRAGAPAVVAAAAAAVAALAVRHLALAVGSFSVGKADTTVSGLRQMRANLSSLKTVGASVLGLRTFPFGTGGVPSAITHLRTAATALVLVAAAVYVIRAVAGVLHGPADGRGGGRSRWWQPEGDEWRLQDLLFLAALGSVISYVALASYAATDFGRYLMPATVFLVVLAGSVAARGWERLRPAGARLAAAAVAVAASAALVAGFGVMVASAEQPRPAVALGDWLAAHGLTRGVGEYWSASITTAETDGRVEIRPALVDDGRLIPYNHEASGLWYSHERFRFAVYRPGAPWGGDNTATFTRALGPPRHVYDVAGGYVVLVYARPFTLPAGR
ncbi:MAG TPA: hypothetical protein VKV25_04050, partial [Acidimicrobiales bacterium]|nr:hypothetical protein [Acidimicrobiales bacterium]